MAIEIRGGALALIVVGAAFLAGCASEAPAPVAPLAAAVSPDQLVGSWGFAAYHRDSDRARTIKEALGQCNRPYVIGKGPNGGVMMHVADSAELTELVLKPGPDGSTYLGPPGPAAGADDRIVSNVDANSFTTTFVDADNAARYGTSVYERCGQKKG
jgi:hypothetical protein